MRRTGQPSIFITGASGLLGGLLLRRYERQNVRLHALRHQRDVSAGTHTDAVPGDITAPLLGLSPSAYDELAGEVTAILHCAAETNFNRPLAESRRVNVEGARNILRFAQHCRRLERVAVVSTAYVAGKRIGPVRETELQHRRGFVNSYERSKYEMECLLRSAMRTVPISVYRLSTIIGHSSTGRVVQFNAFHQALRLYARGLLPLVPGEPDALVDLISSDYAAAAAFHLFEHAFEAGAAYHIVAGDSSSVRLADLLSIAERAFEERNGDWRRRAVSPAPLVSLETFRLFSEATSRTDNPFLTDILRSMNTFAPQLCYPKSFDAARARGALEPEGIRPADSGELAERVIRHCMRTNWSAQRR